jgi:hypothetical protein
MTMNLSHPIETSKNNMKIRRFGTKLLEFAKNLYQMSTIASNGLHKQRLG